ncbi:cytochrome c [Pseudohalocynthiibacter aestuariivivens]|uniref:C-type cytochrome n=1 Tax=Roseovarius pelagicus TaxID=2980108 RepID=A0ABY6DBT6_9RHOB|nr:MULTISPECIES: c-type cytochrome [Rhodobacterales]QIE45614.1 cytochrome c [Pseudohalocynthiibacter aestuariivivens]UXX82468.1 c-type cytochrome [Roseovarius pelagicus]
MKYLIYLTMLGFLAACASVSMPEPDEGRVLYAQYCSQCHGPAGKGNGSWASVVDPKPADLTQLSPTGIFPRARVLSVIDGYHRAGLPDQQMPEFGALLQGESVPVDTGDGVMTPTPRPLAALLAYLESIQET